jgi:hypothetical protein
LECVLIVIFTPVFDLSEGAIVVVAMVGVFIDILFGGPSFSDCGFSYSVLREF